MSKNEIKLQVLISKEIYNKLVLKISQSAIKTKSMPLPISTYVRNLIMKDVNMEKGNE